MEAVKTKIEWIKTNKEIEGVTAYRVVRVLKDDERVVSGICPSFPNAETWLSLYCGTYPKHTYVIQYRSQ